MEGGGSVRGAAPSEPATAKGELRHPLERLAARDVDHLRARVVVRLRHRALLLDPDVVFERALARLAVDRPSDDGAPCGEDWVDRRIDAAIESALVADEEDELGALGGLRAEAGRSRFLAETLGMPSSLACSAAVAFNALPIEVRRVYLAITDRGKTTRECVEDGLGTLAEVLSRLETALRTLGILAVSDRPRAGEKVSEEEAP